MGSAGRSISAVRGLSAGELFSGVCTIAQRYETDAVIMHSVVLQSIAYV
jgi:hypothetical protein